MMLALFEDRTTGSLMIPPKQRSYKIQALINGKDFNGSRLSKNIPLDAGVTELDESGHKGKVPQTHSRLQNIENGQ